MRVAAEVVVSLRRAQEVVAAEVLAQLLSLQQAALQTQAAVAAAYGQLRNLAQAAPVW